MLLAILRYFMSTLRHKWFVLYAGVTIVGKIPIWRLIIHDLSKFNPIEFWNYAIYYQIEKEGNEDRFLAAWMHHQKRNKHHPEYWTTVGIFDWSTGAIDMPATQVREWVADLLGASKEYTGSYDMTDWLKTNKSRYIYCTTETLRRFVGVLAEIGYADLGAIE